MQPGAVFVFQPVILFIHSISINMSNVITLPERSEVNPADTWDLTCLFESDDAWLEACERFESQIPRYESFRGRLAEGPDVLADLFQFDSDLERLGDRLANYAYLKTTEDQTNSKYQGFLARYRNVATRAGEAASFIRPELLAIDDEKMKEFLAAECLEKFRLLVERIIRYKAYTLNDREEQILAMQGEMAAAASNAFRKLNDADLKFGSVTNEKGEQVELSHSTFSQFLESPDRDVRKTAFHQYYDQFAGHENTLAATLAGSVQKDVYYARVRGYDSALHQALFSDDVPADVYDNLISAVRENLPTLYRYYELRRKKMGIDEIHHYDTYVPILSEIEMRHTWDQAVDLVIESLAPLGDEYCRVLRDGLTGRWCDRYPNRNKQSGAFSYGIYDGKPFIMMNYKEEVLRDVFTLTHEAGHSMHTWYSASNQPYEYYNYSIFVAEVASTFNEQLLAKHLIDHAEDERQKAYFINNQIDDIRATIIRQTMFAEFEKKTHAMAEAGEPLTVASFRDCYRELLETYFGPDFTLDECLSLECFRIPHFYRAFYVYQYATGLSAAIALSRRVLAGEPGALEDYLNFLSGGCSKMPLELLADAGVDMKSTAPVNSALTQFKELVDQLEQLLD